MSPCGKHNGRCQHICVLSHRSDNEGLGFRCKCRHGYDLQSDRRTCFSKVSFDLNNNVHCYIISVLLKYFSTYLKETVKHAGVVLMLTFKESDSLPVTTAPPSNRAEGLLAVGHLSCGAGTPTEHFPPGGRHPAPPRAWEFLLWLCCRV